ncbi:MAG TPA: DUF1343 domain-containing protein [Candidatus Limnocylindria bacterium]|nr:DUF1343 domain-containing protein [Candidatus Limnocylindria bacterium]
MRLGRDRIAERGELFIGKRIGLVTNHTGRATIDAFRATFGLAALFSPEHGLRGDAPAGEAVASGVDDATGIPVHSLYGDTKRPTDAMLEGVDVIVYDIQDVAARCFTYVSTLAEVMRACAERGIPVVVLDRPDPLGPLPPDGPVLDMRFASFVGESPVPLRYAMTPGELASFYVDALGIDCALTVVELERWGRRWLDDARITFEPPAPALRSLSACAVYAGTVLFEATNLSVGRGTAAAFESIGAPWLDAARLARVRVEGARLVPEQHAPGAAVRIEVVERDRLRPVTLGVRLLTAIRDAHDELALDRARFDALAGSDDLRRALESGATADDIVRSWREGLEAFGRLRSRYLRYS